MDLRTDASAMGNSLGTGACCQDKASAIAFDTPGMCLSCANGYGSCASPSANTWAIVFKATDGVECCGSTASAP
eukprot:5827443-Alexandrium_andersonii.AAC.1